MSNVIQRVNRAAESILENAALTADLDDGAARVLLDWGIACSRMIAQSTAGLGDVEAAEAMSPRLRATRRLMRLVNRWIPKRQQMDAEGSAALLTEIIEQAAVIYGQDYVPPSNDQQDAILGQDLGESSPQLIQNLRHFIEGLNNDPATHSGGANGEKEHDQEINQENDGQTAFD